MDLYYRDFSARSPVTTGTKWLGALLARIAVALVGALPAGWLTAAQLWVLSFLWAAWMAISVFPVSAALANVINGILLTVGASKLVSGAKDLGKGLLAGLRAAYEARTDSELAEASRLLAPVLNEAVLASIATFAGGSAFRAIQVAVLRAVPIPAWFQARYDQAIFYRDFDPKEPLTSGGRFLAALTARIALVFIASLEHTDLKRRLAVSARDAWVLALILAGWFVVSVLPALAGLANAVNVILLGLGIWVLLDRAKEIGSAVSAGLRGAYQAKTHGELEEAGKALAPAISATLLTAIELFVTHQAFRAAEVVALRRFPIPEWFRARFEKFSEGLAKKTTTKAEPNQSLPPERPVEEPPKSAPERPQSRPQPRPKTEPKPEPKSSQIRRTVATATRLDGARKGAELGGELPLVPLALAGVAVAGTAIVIYATSGRKK